MNRRLMTPAVVLLLLTSFCLVHAQEDVTIVAPTSEAAEGLDLQAVAELFKDTENLEEFEKALNDPEVGINNLDLDENGDVDFIRVVETVEDDAHFIVLQVPLAENEFQDVATIEVEKADGDEYAMHVHGNEVIYGADHYVAPTHIHIHTWPIIGWMYRPVYRPYRSTFYFGVYPRWYRPYRPVTFGVYRTRTVRYTSRTTFTVRRTSRVGVSTRVNYQPRSSTLVRKKTTVTHTTTGPKRTRKVSKTTTSGGKSTTVERSTVKSVNKRPDKSTSRTVEKGVKATSTTKGGKTTTVKAGAKKTTTKGGKTTTVKAGAKKTTVKKGGKKTTVKAGAKKTTVKKGGKRTKGKAGGKKTKVKKGGKRTKGKAGGKKTKVKKGGKRTKGKAGGKKTKVKKKRN